MKEQEITVTADPRQAIEVKDVVKETDAEPVKETEKETDIIIEGKSQLVYKHVILGSEPN